jgi:hypothetical protein
MRSELIAVPRPEYTDLLYAYVIVYISLNIHNYRRIARVCFRHGINNMHIHYSYEYSYKIEILEMKE